MSFSLPKNSENRFIAASLFFVFIFYFWYDFFHVLGDMCVIWHFVYVFDSLSIVRGSEYYKNKQHGIAGNTTKIFGNRWFWSSFVRKPMILGEIIFNEDPRVIFFQLDLCRWKRAQSFWSWIFCQMRLIFVLNYFRQLLGKDLCIHNK